MSPLLKKAPGIAATLYDIDMCEVGETETDRVTMLVSELYKVDGQQYDPKKPPPSVSSLISGLYELDGETYVPDEFHDDGTKQDELTDFALLASDEFSPEVEELLRMRNKWQRIAIGMCSLMLLGGMVMALIWMGSLGPEAQKRWIVGVLTSMAIAGFIVVPILMLGLSALQAYHERKERLWELKVRRSGRDPEVVRKEMELEKKRKEAEKKKVKEEKKRLKEQNKKVNRVVFPAPVVDEENPDSSPSSSSSSSSSSSTHGAVAGPTPSSVPAGSTSTVAANLQLQRAMKATTKVQLKEQTKDLIKKTMAKQLKAQAASLGFL